MSRATTLISLILLLAFSNQSISQEKIKADEIKQLLTGNTILGTWNGDEYKQYFRRDGSTIYAPKRSQSTLGKWRVNPQTNAYESWWERSGWSSYWIIRRDGKLFWTDGGGNSPQPFEILPGEQLVWTQ